MAQRRHRAHAVRRRLDGSHDKGAQGRKWKVGSAKCKVSSNLLSTFNFPLSTFRDLEHRHTAQCAEAWKPAEEPAVEARRGVDPAAEDRRDLHQADERKP